MGRGPRKGWGPQEVIGAATALAAVAAAVIQFVELGPEYAAHRRTVLYFFVIVFFLGALSLWGRWHLRLQSFLKRCGCLDRMHMSAPRRFISTAVCDTVRVVLWLRHHALLSALVTIVVCASIRAVTMWVLVHPDTEDGPYPYIVRSFAASFLSFTFIAFFFVGFSDKRRAADAQNAIEEEVLSVLQGRAAKHAETRKCWEGIALGDRGPMRVLSVNAVQLIAPNSDDFRYQEGPMHAAWRDDKRKVFRLIVADPTIKEIRRRNQRLHGMYCHYYARPYLLVLLTWQREVVENGGDGARLELRVRTRPPTHRLLISSERAAIQGYSPDIPGRASRVLVVLNRYFPWERSGDTTPELVDNTGQDVQSLHAHFTQIFDGLWSDGETKRASFLTECHLTHPPAVGPFVRDPRCAPQTKQSGAGRALVPSAADSG